jgi:hypothetical protein
MLKSRIKGYYKRHLLDSKEDFAKHTIEAHNRKSNHKIGESMTEDIIEKGKVGNIEEDKAQSYNNTENRLLKRVNLENKARKRTRGPYRKSSS